MCGTAPTGNVNRRKLECVTFPNRPPLDRPEHATVYQYQYWDADTSQFVASTQEATLECIRCGLGIAIIESGRQVALCDLDEVGRVKVLEERQSRK